MAGEIFLMDRHIIFTQAYRFVIFVTCRNENKITDQRHIILPFPAVRGIWYIPHVSHMDTLP
jgi:hypothetical protein